MNFPDESDINGFDVENDFLRRLFRIMILPIDDLRHIKYPYDTENPISTRKTFRAKEAK